MDAARGRNAGSGLLGVQQTDRGHVGRCFPRLLTMRSTSSYMTRAKGDAGVRESVEAALTARPGNETLVEFARAISNKKTNAHVLLGYLNMRRVYMYHYTCFCRVF